MNPFQSGVDSDFLVPILGPEQPDQANQQDPKTSPDAETIAQLLTTINEQGAALLTSLKAAADAGLSVRVDADSRQCRVSYQLP